MIKCQIYNSLSQAVVTFNSLDINATKPHRPHVNAPHSTEAPHNTYTDTTNVGRAAVINTHSAVSNVRHKTTPSVKAYALPMAHSGQQLVFCANVMHIELCETAACLSI